MESQNEQQAGGLSQELHFRQLLDSARQNFDSARGFTDQARELLNDLEGEYGLMAARYDALTQLADGEWDTDRWNFMDGVWARLEREFGISREQAVAVTDEALSTYRRMKNNVKEEIKKKAEKVKEKAKQLEEETDDFLNDLDGGNPHNGPENPDQPIV